jgi:transcriptional regulator with XRE-family HTH domain
MARDPEAEAVKSVYEAGKQSVIATNEETEAKLEATKQLFEMAGKVRTAKFFKGISDFALIVLLKQAKEGKAYRKQYGMTWDHFCEHVGIPRRTADQWLTDTASIGSEFLANFPETLGVGINKLKYLAGAVSANVAGISGNKITYDGREVVITASNSEEIKDLFEELEKREQATREEMAAEKKAHDRVREDLHKSLVKAEKELARLKKQVPLDDLTEDERDAMDLLKKVEGDFIQAISTVRKKLVYCKAPAIALRSWYFLLLLMQKVARDERLELHEYFNEAEEPPWEVTDFELPPEHVLVNETPLTRGMGESYLQRITDLAEKRQGKNKE